MHGCRNASTWCVRMGAWEGEWMSFLKYMCFDKPPVIRGAKKEGFYADVQQPSPLAAHLGAGVNAEHGGHLWSPPCWVAMRSPLRLRRLCHRSPPEAVTLVPVSWHFGQQPKSCLGHSRAGGKVGESVLKQWLTGTGGLQKVTWG